MNHKIIESIESKDTESNADITRVIFVRHAQSVYGEDDRNRQLSEEGERDIQIVLETLKDRAVDVFLCSPYKRSYDTIKEAADHFGMDILTDERFRERTCGNHSWEWLHKRWADFSLAEEGGENLRSVQDRNMEALREALNNYPEKTIVIGTHGTALSTILNYYNGDFDVKDFLRIVSLMPYIVELTFRQEELIGITELAYVDKGSSDK